MNLKSKQIISVKRINQLKQLLLKININPRYFTSKNNNYLQLINEALTHTSAEEAINHERLEFLGDAVLRLAASEFIDENFPKLKVGDRSALRSHLVSDSWLTSVGRSIEIEKSLITGLKASGDSSALSTLQAEATEALIGAIYESTKELKLIQTWLEPYWLITSEQVLTDPHKKNSKSALQEWAQSKGFTLPKYHIKELSKKHGNPKRFFCEVYLEDKLCGKGWGGSRKEAEKEAAVFALENLDQIFA